MDNGIGDLRELPEQALNLSRHPAHTLALEVVLTADFLVEHMDVRGILDEYFLPEQKGLHLTVFTGSGKHKHILLEQVVSEAHA